ncbi:unnamed protein product [Heligmosomoides polygyrus]|uniref:SLC3A2_N domain-containing protein n=1 Tax=Heligmosomoides polygyrus TaxID=6339 RepID=A0A183FYQ0_HELPZ|nr:unnamed protein product [Heligmosomoides polygyrus]
MAATQALMAEEGKSGQAVLEKTAEKVIFELEPKTIGLTKEQLEKYRNDPFWKPVRTVLFALFWISWLAMFAGAILIVVLSPKCAEKQKPEWWQTKVSYQIRVPGEDFTQAYNPSNVRTFGNLYHTYYSISKSPILFDRR